MGLFKNKNKNSDEVNILDEKDIQKKLYGTWRSENVSDPVAYEEEISRVIPPSPLPAKAAPSPEPLPAVKETSSEEPDLFKTPDPKEKQSSSDRSSRIVGWVEKENKTISDISAETVKAPSAGAGGAVPTIPKPMLKPKSKVAKTEKKSFVTVVADALRVFFGATVGFFLLFDLRKPVMRKAFFILFVAGFVALLFFGVNFLNAQREVAMKNPSPKKISAVESKVRKKKTLESKGTVAKKQKSVVSPTNQAETQQAVLSPEVSVVLPVSEANEKAYVIQIATYSAQDDADRMAEKLRAQNHPAFVKSLSRSSGKLYYCVFIGRFSDYQEAETGLEIFKKDEAAKPFQDAFIRSL